jgi:hypothetical protein
LLTDSSSDATHVLVSQLHLPLQMIDGVRGRSLQATSTVAVFVDEVALVDNGANSRQHE